MEKKRKGEIAHALNKYRIIKSGNIPIITTTKAKRELGNISKATKIPLQELEEYGKELAAEVYNETYGK